MDINTAAPVITRDEIFIHAPIQTIWDIQTDVASWPSWQPDVDSAQADGPPKSDRCRPRSTSRYATGWKT